MTLSKTSEIPLLIQRLQAELRSLRYSETIDLPAVAQGSPIPLLPILSYCFNKFSRPLLQEFLSKGYVLSPSSDSAFVQTIYKILRQEYNFNPVLSPSQFLTKGFAEKRLQLLLEIIRLLKSHHQQLHTSRSGVVIQNHARVAENPPKPQPRAVPSPVPKLESLNIRESNSVSDSSQFSSTSAFTSLPPSIINKSSTSYQGQPLPSRDSHYQSSESKVEPGQNSMKAIARTLDSMNSRISSSLSLIERRLSALETRVKFIEEGSQ
ncbi:hypothetical protein GEMRC1_004174 [Eukaryota sp. GEM-RC1]